MARQMSLKLRAFEAAIREVCPEKREEIRQAFHRHLREMREED